MVIIIINLYYKRLELLYRALKMKCGLKIPDLLKLWSPAEESQNIVILSLLYYTNKFIISSDFIYDSITFLMIFLTLT